MGSTEPSIIRVEENPTHLHGEGPGGALWGIVDCARDDSLYPLVATMNGDAICLFEGNLEPVVLAASPHLVRLRENNFFLNRWRKEGLGHHWGIFFRSDADQQTLRRHFRKKLFVKLPDGRRVLFRFYDPRVAASSKRAILDSERNF